MKTSVIKNDISIYGKNPPSDNPSSPKFLEFRSPNTNPPKTVDFFIEVDDLLRLTKFDRKRLNLYLFRNKGIPRATCLGGRKLIDLRCMLQYLGNTIQTLEAKKKSKKSS